MIALAALLVIALPHGHLLRDEVIAGRDLFRIAIPDSALLLRAIATGEWPLWNPFSRLGQPFAATLQAQVFYPLRLLALLFGPVRAPTVEHLLHAYVASAGLFLAVRAAGRSRRSAAIVAVAFALSPALINLGFLPNLTGALAWTGFILAATLRLLRRPSAGALAALSAAIALSLLTGAPEITAWQLVAVGLIALGSKRGAVLWRGGAGVVLGFGLAAFLILPAAEFALLSDRTMFANQLDWSNDLGDVLGLFALGGTHPDGTPEGYWTDQNLILSFFVGTSATVFAVYGFLSHRRLWPLAGLAVLTALLSLGSSFAPAGWLLTHTPLKLFRYPTKYLLVTCYLTVWGAAFGLDRLTALMRRSRVAPSPRLWFGAAAGLALGGVLAVVAWRIGRQSLAIGFGAMGVVLALTTYGLWVHLGESRPRVRVLSFAAIWSLELLLAASLTSFMSIWDPATLTRPSPLTAQLGDLHHSRVSIEQRLEPQDPGASDGRSVFIATSRQALVPMRNAEEGVRALEGDGAPIVGLYAEAIAEKTAGLSARMAVSHFIGREAPPGFTVKELARPDPLLPAVFSTAQFWPRAHVAHDVRGGTARRIFEEILEPIQVGPPTAWVSLKANVETDPCQGSSARITDEGLNHVTVEVDACGRGLLVLVDTFYPGWEVTVDGEPGTILRTNHLVRGTPIGPGAHRVEYRYRPLSFRLGAWVSLLSAAILLLSLVRSRMHRRATG